MIQTVAAIAMALLAQQPVDKPTLELYQQRFIVRTGNEALRVPLQVISEPPASVMFRKDNTYSVWDERGLTARSGDWSFSTRLKEFPSSSRFFTRDEILKTIDLVNRGIRNMEAKAISGAKRLGNYGYFLVRWDDSNGKSWLEALVSIDLSTPKSKPKVLGRFDGLSLGTQVIDDRLMLRNEGLEAAVQTAEGWGIGRYDPKDEQFSYRQFGDELESFSVLPNDLALFVEQSSYGLSTVAQVDLKTGDRRLIYQGRTAAKLLDARTPELILAGRLLHYADTGAEHMLGTNDEVRRVGKWVLIWSPALAPKTAKLYDPARWTEVATWRAKG